MSKIVDVAVIVGSLRRESLNRKMALNLASLAPAHLRLEIVEIRSLALYDEDADVNPPAPWTEFRERIRRSDALLFVTPEYNRSIPAPLKNALDVGSRPYGKSAWASKPAAVVSVSPGAIGGFGANHHLRQTFVFLDVQAMQQPEAYVGGAGGLFDEQGALANEKTREFMTKFMQAFSEWIEILSPRR